MTSWFLVYTSIISVFFYTRCTESDLYSCPPSISHSNDSIVVTNAYACQSIDCSFIAGCIRSQYLCDQWPFYTGLWPQWMQTSTSYACDANVSHCAEWKALHATNNDSHHCYCVQYSSSNHYCRHWVCLAFEIPSFSSSNIMQQIEICNQSKNGVQNNVYCPSSEMQSSRNGNEFKNCWCSVESHTTNFCQRWYCEHYEYDTISDENLLQQTEWQKCVSMKSPSSQSYAAFDDLLCWKWIGDAIVIDEKWMVNECVCEEPAWNHNGQVATNAFCAKWQCNQLGMEDFANHNTAKKHVLLFWVWLFVFGIFCAFLSCSCCGALIDGHRDQQYWKCGRKLCFAALCIFSVCLLPMASLFIAGFPNFVVYTLTAICAFWLGCCGSKHCRFCGDYGIGERHNGYIATKRHEKEKEEEQDQEELEHGQNHDMNVMDERARVLTNYASHSLADILEHESECNDDFSDMDRWINPDGKVKRTIAADFDELDDRTVVSVTTATL